MAEDTKPISPDDREGHFAAKAEGDSNPALSRLGAGARLFGADRAHIERMVLHGLTKDEVPVSVFFFPNGMAAVCNAAGKQIAKLQGDHAYTVKALQDAGYDWRTLHEVCGVPR
jgi:hypothetical protein